MMRMIVPVVLGAMVLGAPTFAQNMPAQDMSSDAAKCTALMQQFDNDIRPSHINDQVAVTKSQALRDEGGKLCTAGKAAAGAEKVRQALEVWDVTPRV